VWSRSHDLLLHFGAPFISLQLVKLETSNLVCRLTARPANQNAKVGQNGHGLRNVAYYYNFGTPLSLKWVKLETSNLVFQQR